METMSCKTCGKLFNYISGLKLCPSCSKKMEEKFSQVKEYIYEHHTASMADVANEFDIPTQQIKRWVREERLAFSEDSPVTLNCESCGAIIRTGRFCANCKRTMVNEFQGMYKKLESEKQKKSQGRERMRFLNN